MARVPLGIIILAILNFLTGLLLFLGSTPLLSEFSWILLSNLLSSIPYSILIVALIYIVLGLGLFTLAKWAWFADILFAIFNLLIIVLDVLGIFGSPGGIPWVALILNIIIVLYLNQRSIKNKF
ncbi:MAG: hypothetical protein P1Q69_11105 [Candidatus Thorarchaeota archaeon]|nr:hypothetical protein [Candidatus Thorarchaeota archaeon]